MKLCVYTDEISRDFPRALHLGWDNNIRRFGLRTVYGKRFPFYDEEDMLALINFKQKRDCEISMITPGIYRNSVEQTPWEQLKQFGYPEMLKQALSLDSMMFIVFGSAPVLNETEYHYMLENIRKFAFRASARSCVTVIGGSTASYCRSAADLLKVWRDTGDMSLGISWDPCGGYMSGGFDMEDEWKTLAPHIKNIRLRDAKQTGPAEWTFTPVGSGEVEWVKIFKMLRKNKYRGLLTLETHAPEPEEAFLTSVGYLKKQLDF